LELVFFDFEEAFFLGSHEYARHLTKKGVHASLINLEMIGWDSPVKGRVEVFCRSAGRPGNELDLKLALAVADHLVAQGLKAEALPNNFDRSDNWPFWEELHTAVTVSQDWKKNFNGEHYHTSADTPDTVDWPFTAKIAAGVEGAVRALEK
jgi:Zn-dependent M28 family amino/carboxypeptidase